MIDTNRKFLPIYDCLYRHKSIEPTWSPGTATIRYDTRPGTPYDGLVRQACVHGAASLTECFLNLQFFGGGPKVYRPSSEECAALINIRAEIPIAEYRQPFDTFAVEFPADYARSLANEAGHHPYAVLCFRSPHSDFVLSAVEWSDGSSTTNALIDDGRNETLEALLARVHGRRWDASLDCPPDEADTTERCVRLAMNACLLLTHLGARRVGYANEELAGRLERQIRKGNKHAEANRLELRAVPVVYGFASDVRLYDQENGDTQAEGGDGRVVSPHWRRGHFRMQPHGPGLAERKRIFVRPTFVRADRFGGQASSTSTAYSH